MEAYSNRFFFLSDEKEKEFRSQPPEVQKAAMYLLERTVKQSMRELTDDLFMKKIEDLEKRISKLETMNVPQER
jgi:hypothetical protein